MTFVPDPFWNEIYAQPEFVYGTEPNEYLVAQALIHQNPAATILCIADGEGRNGVYLAKQYDNSRVITFDASDVAVSKAQQFAQDNGVSDRMIINNCDCNSFSGWTPNTYDMIVGIFIQFADHTMRQQLFKDVYHSLKPGGVFILQGYTPKQLEYKTGGPPKLEPLYTEEMIRELARDCANTSTSSSTGTDTCLEIVDMQCYEKVMSEGSKHCGMSALLGMTARKPVVADA